MAARRDLRQRPHAEEIPQGLLGQAVAEEHGRSAAVPPPLEVGEPRGVERRGHHEHARRGEGAAGQRAEVLGADLDERDPLLDERVGDDGAEAPPAQKDDGCHDQPSGFL